MVLKTLKRVAATPPPSPTLHKVSRELTRRVIPKAPPPKPKPVSPPEPPKPVEKAPVPAPAATPVPAVTPTPTPAALRKETPAPVKVSAPDKTPAEAPVSPKPIEKKKEPAKTEPTATYKMPAPGPFKATPIRPSSPKHAAPASSGTSSGVPVDPSTAKSAPADAQAPAPVRTKVRIPEVLTVKDLAECLGTKPIDVIKKMLSLGTMVTINQQIDSDVATLAADALGFDIEIIPIMQEQVVEEEKEDPAKLKPRPPIVTIMGHVDHGKTSLLDTIRQTSVAAKEAGGITQHIGAYRVHTAKGDVVFLDTPGHEAFTAMRARGAQATDIVVLVVAADDGVMPQTLEAIDHARAAGVPIMVAINKIDLPTANVERIKRDLSQHQLVSEEWGGKTIFVEVSAKKGTNIDKLLEMLSLETELLELKADPDRSAAGVIVEARLDPRRGALATLLIQKGTLHAGDIVVAGLAFGRVRALSDDRGTRLEQAGPATPVEILGLTGIPQAGERFIVMADEREARSLVERRQLVISEQIAKQRHVTLETLHERVADGKMRELKIIIKADVQGSVQALRDALDRMSTDEIRLNVIHAGVGGINETDVTLADASDAVIIGFNVRADAKSEEIARREDVDIRTYRIIYEAIADVRAAMEGLLEPEKQEIRIGRAEIRQVFKVSKGGTIGGSLVSDGQIVRGAKARLLRDNVVVHEGTIESLKRFKDDARDVDKGFECGIGLGNFQDIKQGDVVECYREETRARKLEESK
ncbi:MAG: translation initiation factor IF-2 [Elusimicrobiota bacterium]|jgi:translation initiation factor IF-2